MYLTRERIGFYGFTWRDVSAFRKQGNKLCFGLADTTYKPGRYCSGPSAQNEPVAGRLDRRADHGEIVEQIASDIHISVSAPGDTAPSRSSGIMPHRTDRGRIGSVIGPILCHLTPIPHAIRRRGFVECVGGRGPFSGRLLAREHEPGSVGAGIPERNVARYCRPRPCGSAIAFTGSAKIPLLVSRKGNVVARVVANVTSDTLTAFVREAVSHKVSLLAPISGPDITALTVNIRTASLITPEANMSLAQFTLKPSRAFGRIFKRGVVGTFHKMS